MSEGQGDSLIKREQEQGALFPQELVDEAFEPLEKRGVFTAERLFKQRPLTYRQIVVLSAHNLGQMRIGKALGVSPSTVRAVQRREGETIDIVKAALSEKFMDVAGLAAEELRERLENNPKLIETKDLVVLAGITTDKALLLAGQATQRLEIAQVNVGTEEFKDFLASMTGGVAADVGTKAREGASAGAGSGAVPGAGAGAGDGGEGPVIDVPPDDESGDGECK